MRSASPGRTVASRDGSAKSYRGRQALLLLGLLAGVFLIGAALAVFYQSLSYRPPAGDSAEAGFARDMAVHHAQAVQMAEILQRRTRSGEIRNLATDIALTQQGQIGQMQGWLAAWRLPQTGDEAPMTWMGAPTNGLMPGMATPDQISSLETLPPDEADKQFLRLMIPHHRAAIPMAQAILKKTDRPEVKQLASAIVASQQSEIAMMEDLLRSRGATPPAEKDMHMGHEMSGS